jgi:FlaA1/EpsC-like NDP-sugar epimerase
MANFFKSVCTRWCDPLSKDVEEFNLKNLAFRVALPLLDMPRIAKRFIAFTVDLFLCVAAVWVAYYLRLGGFINFDSSSRWGESAIWATLVSVSLALPIFVSFGLYRAIFRHSGWPALLTVAAAVGVYSLVYILIFTVIGFAGVPRTIGIIQPILLLMLVGASRALASVLLGGQYQKILKRATRPKALIYGAGRSGRQLVAAMANSHEMQIVGFLDDDDRLHGHVLNGQPIYDPAKLISLVSDLDVSDVLLAMPNINRGRRHEILQRIGSAHVSVRTVPSMNDLAQGKVQVSDLRELDVDDLLGREPVLPNQTLLEKNVTNKVVLVTGAGGSIGGELCRQIMALGPSKLLLIEQSEFALYAIHQELLERHSEQAADLIPLLATVLDERRMLEIMSAWCPDTVYHAAAYKHVPLVEHNPTSGIQNNVMGTLRAAMVAAQVGVADFVLISTDKAVRPTNVMGASKRLAEMVLQALAAANLSHTNFTMVRFGNVLDSSGSVVPKFREQIRQGGPITLTHPEVTRYFMTIPEAAQLVIQAGAMANGGDVFVLNMGDPVKIINLAKRMVELSGLALKDETNPSGTIEINVTGMRPGEKLYEELLIGDNPLPTVHARIMKAHEQFIPWVDLEPKLNELAMSLDTNDVNGLRLIMQNLVCGYTPDGEIVDWVYLAQGGSP